MLDMSKKARKYNKIRKKENIIVPIGLVWRGTWLNVSCDKYPSCTIYYHRRRRDLFFFYYSIFIFLGKRCYFLPSAALMGVTWEFFFPFT